MDGYEVFNELKGDPSNSDIPIIFLTALNSDADIEKGLKMGAADYITKPVNPVILQVRINTHLKLKMAKDLISNKNLHL